MAMSEQEFLYIDTKTYDELVIINKKQSEIIQDLMTRVQKLRAFVTDLASPSYTSEGKKYFTDSARAAQKVLDSLKVFE